MDLDWDDDSLRVQVRRLRGQIGRKRKQPMSQHGQGTAPSAAQSPKVKKRTVKSRAAQGKVKKAKSEREKKPRVVRVAKVSSRRKRPLHTPLANAWLKVNLASSDQAIRVGTECSGLEAVMVAMEKMGLMNQTQLKFICEKDAAARRLTLSHASPSIVYEDITTRAVEHMPVCDVYAAGFPCQPWSTAGLSEGTADRQGRGRIFPHIHNYIQMKAPTCFLLENVKGMTTGKHKDAFASVLNSLRDGLHNKYMVSWRVLNTADFGLPQNRPRLYIIGMRRDAIKDQSRFLWPRPLGCVPLDSVLDLGVNRKDHQPKIGTIADSNLQMLLGRLHEKVEPLSGPAALDIFASRGRASQGRPMVGLVPCLTRTRAASGGYWITGIDRLLTTREMLRLQGLPEHFTELAENSHVTDRQLRQMIGNAMSVNVLVAIMSRLLPAVGLA